MTSMSTKKTVVLLMTVLAVGSAGVAVAQSTSGSVVGDTTPAAAPSGEKTVRMLFAHADRNKDGKLTRDEAKVHLPITHGNFDAIDTDRRGWIDLEQFLVFTKKRVGLQADDILKAGDRL